MGNLIDRIFFGGVIDYLGFVLFNGKMPIFNFADIVIVVGIGLLLISVVVLTYKKKKYCKTNP